MPYPTNGLRTTLQWALPDGERAQCRVHWYNADDAWSLDDDLADAMAVRGATYWEDIGGLYDSSVLYEGMRVQELDTAGHVVTTKDRFQTGEPGNRSEKPLPHEVAVVVSIRTTNDGRSGRGRMYLPPPATGLLTDSGRFLEAGATAAATGTASFLAPVTVAGSSWLGAVQSPAKQLYYFALSVSVGDVFDSQRRRRDNLSEVRQTATI